MSRIVSRAESWQSVYSAFQNINFAAFDFNTVKQSIIDYVKLYFPETFNDYIESSEQIAIIESFAYIAELMSYRFDVNAQENFMSTAQRRDSILRLAKFISYTAARPIPARGLVKINTIQTTEPILDTNGSNMSGVTVRWNDVNNPDWKNQFILVMNRVLEQQFGSVRPSDRFQIQDVVFEIYGVDATPLKNGVFPYSVSVNGTAIPMELVPVTYQPSLGILERRPKNKSNFTFMYGSDGLGDGSDTTGFFCFTKQGTLRKITTTFDGITPNQTFDVTTPNVNDIDIWLNNIDPSTGQVIESVVDSALGIRSLNNKTGEWEQVDLAHAQNVIFNTNPIRSKYEVETRSQNAVRLIFGDGEFADIPSGMFDVWYRTSLDESVVVPQSSVVNQQASITYLDDYGQTQTLSFTFSLISTLQNASASESTEHVRNVAPAVYYTQDRMVNAQDYNTYMLQDPSILKLRSVNRTFSGDSKYMAWHDPSGTYDNVKTFGDDGCVYFEERQVVVAVNSEVSDYNSLIASYVQPMLSSTDVMMRLISNGVSVDSIRRTFSSSEVQSIRSLLETSAPPAKIDMYYNTTNHSWYPINRQDSPSSILAAAGWPTTFITTPIILIDQTSSVLKTYSITRNALRLIFESPSTKFWSTNSANRVINFDTLKSDADTIVILNANTNDTRSGILKQHWDYNVIGLETIDSGTELGQEDVTRLSIMPTDQNGDNVPDYVTAVDWQHKMGLSDFMIPKIQVTAAPGATQQTIKLPIPIVVGHNDLSIMSGSTANCAPSLSRYNNKFINGLLNPQYGSLVTEVVIDVHPIDLAKASTFVLGVNEYVYFNRAALKDQWQPKPTSIDNMSRWSTDFGVSQGQEDKSFWTRKIGRALMNFAWFHATPRYYLVDPAPTNINDSFIISKGYYESMRRWLVGQLDSRPRQPTPLDLRTSYGYMIDNKMISDTVVLHSGRFKILFGPNALPELRAKLKVVTSDNKSMTDNQIKTTIVTVIRNFFDIRQWEFGETFYFTELATAIHTALPKEISSIVLVPSYPRNQFGDMFEISCREDELFIPDISVNDIDMVSSFTPVNLRM